MHKYAILAQLFISFFLSETFSGNNIKKTCIFTLSFAYF